MPVTLAGFKNLYMIRLHVLSIFAIMEEFKYSSLSEFLGVSSQAQISKSSVYTGPGLKAGFKYRVDLSWTLREGPDGELIITRFYPQHGSMP